MTIGWGRKNPYECWGVRQRRAHLTPPGQDEMKCRHTEVQPGMDSLCIPLLVHGRIFGLLHLAAFPEDLLEEKVLLARAVGDTIALALSDLRMRDMLLQQSIHDPLTHLYNRRYLDEILQRELGRAARGNRPLALIMADIDHFKRFNDLYGHLIGDKVLQKVSRELKDGIRSDDMAFRYGGEEFLLILPETGLDAALERAEDLRLRVRSMELKMEPDIHETVSISLGVAVYPVHGDTVVTLLEAADTAMYRAKQAGRDRVEAAREINGGQH